MGQTYQLTRIIWLSMHHVSGTSPTDFDRDVINNMELTNIIWAKLAGLNLWRQQ